MKVVSIVGARPQFVKLAPMAEAFADAGVDHVIIHTGQHYDANMSDVFFEDLAIPQPDFDLGIGSASHGVQTGNMVAGLDPILEGIKPDWILVYGDTNSTLAGAIAATKLHLRVAHLEAGLRSFNRKMPEEANRILTDHASDLLLAPTQTAMNNLANEGLVDRSVLVGDVIVDVCLRVAEAREGRPMPLPEYALEPSGYIIATIHRAENTDDPERLRQIISALRTLSMPVLLVAHPRLHVQASENNIELDGEALRLIDPQPYPKMIQLVENARAVVTYSGGLQKEAFVLGTPCMTVRNETEWPETSEDGRNRLCMNLKELGEPAMLSPSSKRGTPFDDGRTSEIVARELLRNV